MAIEDYGPHFLNLLPRIPAMINVLYIIVNVNRFLSLFVSLGELLGHQSADSSSQQAKNKVAFHGSTGCHGSEIGLARLSPHHFCDYV